MSDTALNQIVRYGTNAERIAFTPNPAASSKVLYLWYETDNAPDLYAWNGSAWVLLNAAVAGGITQLTGNVTAGPGSGSQVATIPNDTVTYAKMQNVSAADRLLGRGNGGGAGDVQEITLGAGLALSGTTLNASGGSLVALPTLTPPIDGDFAWINQGGASVTAAGGTIYLLGPAGSGINFRIRKKAAPATPYTITAVFLTTGFLPDFHQMGLLFRDSTTGELHLFSIQANSGGSSELFLNSVKYNSPTVFNALYRQGPFYPGRLVILRIADDGTNRICSISPDGINWIIFHSVARLDFLTPDEVGFAVNCEDASSTDPVGMTLISWTQA